MKSWKNKDNPWPGEPPATLQIMIMKERIEKWKELDQSGSPLADEYLRQISREAVVEGKGDQMNALAAELMADVEKHLDTAEAAVADYTLHQRMGSLTDVINLAYIAEHYFGKSRQWLYQRLKGQIVNGKPAAFKPQEEETFKAALNDIGLRIAAFTAAV